MRSSRVRDPLVAHPLVPSIPKILFQIGLHDALGDSQGLLEILDEGVGAGLGTPDLLVLAVEATIPAQ